MKEIHVLNLGAGVQSTALYLMNDYDVAIFADTGEEPAAVYSHLDWLKSLGKTPILVRSKGSLGDDLIGGVNSTGGRFASIPAFTKNTKTGEVGLARRQCSKEYKLAVIDRAIRRDVLGMRPKQRLSKSVRIHQYIGISLDESGRAARLRKFPRAKQFVLHFPLIENHWTRADCLNWLQTRVPHQVPRSACVFCPYRDEASWLAIKAQPDEWARAVAVDEALRTNGNHFMKKFRADMYLHRSCIPLVQIEFDPNPSKRAVQLSLNMSRECLGVCGV